MPREKSKLENRSDDRNSNRGGRQNISSKRGFAGPDEDNQRRTSAKGGRKSLGGRSSNLGMTSEDSNRSE